MKLRHLLVADGQRLDADRGGSDSRIMDIDDFRHLQTPAFLLVEVGGLPRNLIRYDHVNLIVGHCLR